MSEPIPVTRTTDHGTAKQSFGRNPLDPSVRAAAARAGRKQAAIHAAEAAEVWQG